MDDHPSTMDGLVGVVTVSTTETWANRDIMERRWEWILPGKGVFGEVLLICMSGSVVCCASCCIMVPTPAVLLSSSATGELGHLFIGGGGCHVVMKHYQETSLCRGTCDVCVCACA